MKAPAWEDGDMPKRSGKQGPEDLNSLARRIVEEATNEEPPVEVAPEKDPAAVALGRKGGLKGGKARAEGMTPRARSMSARKAAKARWSREP